MGALYIEDLEKGFGNGQSLQPDQPHRLDATASRVSNY